MFGIDKRLLATATTRWIVIGALTGIASVVLSLVLYSLIGANIDAALTGQQALLSWLPWLLVILLAKGLLAWLGRLGSYNASAETKLSIRDQVYEHALRLGPGILGNKRTRQLVNMAVDGMEWLELFFGVYFVQFLIGMATPIILCIFIFFIDWVVGLTLLISIPMTPVFFRMFAHRFRKVSDRYFEMNSHLSAQFPDNLQGMTTLKLFNQGKPRGEKIYAETEHNRVETMRLLLVNQIMIFFTDWGFALGTTVVMTVVALLRLRAGFVTPGEVFALVLISSEFARPLTLIGAFFFAGAIGREVAGKARDFLSEEPAVSAPVSPVDLAHEPVRLEFEDVVFSYPGTKKPALDGVSFAVEPGETVALIGRSGGGKTTATHLLLRFFAPQSGKIHIGDLLVDQLGIDELRSRIALVPQDPYLFYGTVAENLRIAKADATQDELEQAARAANIHEHIKSMSKGYETLVGERGLSLSGGQAQRIAIARAILKDAPSVILDEPTSQIDVAGEAVIRAAIERLTQTKTVLLIAHRLSTVEQADRIVVLDDGQVAEIGTPAQLLGSTGAYAGMLATHQQAMEAAHG